MPRRPSVFISGQELIDLGMCPFADPDFYLDNDVPCPICGALGGADTNDACVGNGTRKPESPR